MYGPQTPSILKKMDETKPIYGPFFGVMGAASAMIFSGKVHFKLHNVSSQETRGKRQTIFVPECRHRDSANYQYVILSKLVLIVLSYSNHLIFHCIVSSFRCCLWHSQVRSGNCCHVSHETRADYEIHHPCSHGWYHCNLRACCCSPHCKQT